MSEFYGTLQGNRGQATRCGSKSSGILTQAASWDGAIQVSLGKDEHGRTTYDIHEITWHGAGRSRLIERGLIGGSEK